MTYTYEDREHKTKRPMVNASAPKEAVDFYHDMRLYLEARQLSYEVAKKNGWYPSWDAGDDFIRVVIPCTNAMGLCYWQARAISKKAKIRYQSPPVPRGDNVVIVWPMTTTPTTPICLVEGPADALAAAGEGLIGVAFMGNKPSEETWTHIISKFFDRDFVIVPDADSQDAGAEWLTRLAVNHIPTKLKLTTPFKDLAAMPKINRRRFLRG